MKKFIKFNRICLFYILNIHVNKQKCMELFDELSNHCNYGTDDHLSYEIRQCVAVARKCHLMSPCQLSTLSKKAKDIYINSCVVVFGKDRTELMYAIEV